MNVSGNDVKVLGKVVSIAVDNIVADAEQVFDKNSNLNQETINRNMTNAINQAVADVASINTRVGSLEDAIDDKLNISDYQTSAALMRDSIMLMISEVEEQKQDVLTFDNTPTANSNNPVKSGGIKSAIDTITSNIKNSLSTYDIKILYDNNGQDVQYADLYSNADGVRFSISASDFMTSSTGDISIASGGNISITSHGEDGVSLSADNGGAVVSSSTTTSIIGNEEIGISSDSAININAGEAININAPSVEINGKDVSSTINNIFPSGSYTGSDRTTTPGLYLYDAGVDRNHFTPSIDEYTTGLLIVTHEHGIDDSTGDAWNNVCQLFIDMNGNRYSRRLPYTNRVQDIDWTNAPDFTLRS